MKKVVCVISFLFGLQSLGQVNPSSCVNPGFEDGTTNGWGFEQATSGNIMGVNLPCDTCANTPGGIEFLVNPTGTFGMCNQNNNGIDYYSGLPIVSPLTGNYSLLLNDACSNAKMQKASYTFVVDTATSYFTAFFMAVLQSGAHTPDMQPYFHINVTNVSTNSLIAQYTGTAPSSGTLTGWNNSTSDSTVYYTPWLNFITHFDNSLASDTIRVDFIVSDCNQGGHFGYMYIDAVCDSIPLPPANCNHNIASSTICFVSADSVPNNEIYFNHSATNFQGTVIYRKNSLSTWDSIGYVPSSQPDYFVDATANPNQQSYTYATAQIDSCGNLRPKSSAHTTILLQSSIGTSGQINLSWNAYVGAAIPYYYIYRGSSPSNMTLLTQVSSSTYAYTDLNPLPGSNYYKVALPVPTCSSNEAHDSLVSSNYRVNATSSIAVYGNSMQIKIYPNPAKNILYIQSPEVGTKIEITDLLGKTILMQILNSTFESINIQELSNGTYFVKISDSKGVYCRKFVAE